MSGVGLETSTDAICRVSATIKINKPLNKMVSAVAVVDQGLVVIVSSVPVLTIN